MGAVNYIQYTNKKCKYFKMKPDKRIFRISEIEDTQNIKYLHFEDAIVYFDTYLPELACIDISESKIYFSVEFNNLALTLMFNYTEIHNLPKNKQKMSFLEIQNCELDSEIELTGIVEDIQENTYKEVVKGYFDKGIQEVTSIDL
jgi:hypothetical protein